MSLSEKQKEIFNKQVTENKYLRIKWVDEWELIINVPLFTKRWVNRHSQGLRDLHIWGPTDNDWGVWKEEQGSYYHVYASLAVEDGLEISGRLFNRIPLYVLEAAEEFRLDYLKESE